MAVIFTEGFDSYGTTSGSNDILTRWLTNSSGLPSSTTPYTYGQSFSINAIVARTATVAIGSTLSAFTLGVAVRHNRLYGSSGSVSTPILSLLSSSTSHVNLQFNTNGSIQINRSNTFLGVTDPGLVSANNWYYIELAVTISDTVGTVRIDLDGTTVLSLSNVDTRNGTPTTIDTLLLGNGPGSGGGDTAYFDDIYLTDNTTPLGPQRIYTLAPVADTVEKDWAPLSGSDNFAMVDEIVVDGDTTYVQGSTVGDFDLYDTANVSITGTVSCINHHLWAKKTDVATREITLTTKSSSTITDSANVTLGTSYKYYNKIYETNPATSTAWSESTINSLQIGQKVVT